jgi:hypothetical protein
VSGLPSVFSVGASHVSNAEPSVTPIGGAMGVTGGAEATGGVEASGGETAAAAAGFVVMGTDVPEQPDVKTPTLNPNNRCLHTALWEIHCI